MIRAGQEFLWYICALHLFDTNFICVASEPQVQVKSVKFAGTTGITESASNQKNSTQLNSTLWKETPLEGRVPSKLWLLQGLPFRSDRNHHEIHTAKAVRPLNPSFPGGMISSVANYNHKTSDAGKMSSRSKPPANHRQAQIHQSTWRSPATPPGWHNATSGPSNLKAIKVQPHFRTLP